MPGVSQFDRAIVWHARIFCSIASPALDLHQRSGELAPVLFNGYARGFDDLVDLLRLLTAELVELRARAADEIEAQAFQLLAELRILD